MIKIEFTVDAVTEARLIKRAERLGVPVSELIRNIILKGAFTDYAFNGTAPKELSLRTMYELYKGYCKLCNIKPMLFDEFKLGEIKK